MNLVDDAVLLYTKKRKNYYTISMRRQLAMYWILSLYFIIIQLIITTESWGNMEITLPSFSPEVNTYMSDRIKVAEYHAIYINFWKLLKKK